MDDDNTLPLVLQRLSSTHYTGVKLVVRGTNCDSNESFVIPVSMFKLFGTLAHKLSDPPTSSRHQQCYDLIDNSSDVETLNLSTDSCDQKVLSRLSAKQDSTLVVCLEDETSLTISDLLFWLFRDPDFVISLENLQNLLRISKIYGIAPLQRELEEFLHSQGESFVIYVVAINSNIGWLELKLRSWVFARFDIFIEEGHHLQLSNRNVT